MKLLIINGPNLNMLGIREPHIYGNKTYNDLVCYIKEVAGSHGVDTEIFQSNHEGDIIDKIQTAYGKADGIVINAAGYTHTSVAILDALKAVDIPAVEVHLSDINSREEFRKISYPGLICKACYCGFGFEGYKMAIEYLLGLK